MWSQNIEKIHNLVINSNIFTVFFQGLRSMSRVSMSYGNFGYLDKNQIFFIIGEFYKRTHCPSIETVALLFFLYCYQDYQIMGCFKQIVG